MTETEAKEKYCRIYAEIDLDRIVHNAGLLREKMPGGQKFIAVVKADAYGHGAARVSEALGGIADAYAAATVEEAMQLRKSGVKKPIYTLGFIPCSRIADAVKNKIRMTVYERVFAEEVSQTASAMGQTAELHIKIDTGMRRIGFEADSAAADEIEKISSLPNIHLEGIFTHLATADEHDKSASDRQIGLFRNMIEMLEARGVRFPVIHCENSAAIMDCSYRGFTAARAGIAIYGMFPSENLNDMGLDLRPALQLKSRVIYIKKIPAGTPVGYGGTFVTRRPTLLATIPAGYADGVPRALSNKGSVIIRGQKAPIAGNICMDQMMADVTDIEGAQKGDEVTIIGESGGKAISAADTAKLTGTINYEITCGISKRVPRIFYRNGKFVGGSDYFSD
ncbi:MAG: alanine racemase [Synergistes sp.]|nr:alanine racemase [Synergistes sp.]